MQIIDKKLTDLKPYANNPRHNAKAVPAVKESILKFGFKVPLVIDKNNVIVCGHTRFYASKEIGLDKVPCIVADDLTDEQINAFRLVDNRVSEFADWNFDKLAEELSDLQDFDFEPFAFDDLMAGLELDYNLNQNDKEAIEDDYNAEPPVETNIKYGDIYQLGSHRLMCGNSTKEEDVEKLLNNNICELTFTDPPYQLETQGGGIFKNSNSMKQIKENKVDQFEPLNLKLYSKTNIYCHNKPLIKKYIELSEKFNKSYDLCFYKKICSVPNYAGHLMSDCEYIAIIGEQNPNKGLEKELYSKCYIGKKDADNELSYSKPVELCSKFIKLYSKKNVLDLFGGSGSTLIACEQLNRKCYMMELDEHYVQVIIDRYIKFTGKDVYRINSDGTKTNWKNIISNVDVII